MHRNKIISNIIFFVILLIFTGCQRPGQKTQSDAENPVKKTPVRIQEVSTGSISQVLVSSGIIEGWSDILMTAEVGGKLEKIYIDEGQPVKKGDLILNLDYESLLYQLTSAEAGLKSAEQTLKKIEKGIRPEELAQIEAQLKSAETNFKNAEENYSRMQELFNEGVKSKAELDAAESQLAGAKAAYETALKNKELADLGARDEDRESAKAAVQSAKAQRDLLRETYEKAFFRSPIDGKVAFIYVDPGEMVNPGTPLVNVVSFNRLKLPVALSAEEAIQIKEGQEVDIIPEALGGEVFTGHIVKIDVKADERSGTFKSEIEIPNEDERILPGMTATASLKYGAKDGVIVIPFDSILNRGLCKFVFTIEQEKAVMRQVFTGIVEDNKVEITGGLEVGQKLIIEGHKELVDGDAVEVQEENK